MGALSSLGRTNKEIDFPYITSENGERYVKNIKDGTLIGYKYMNLGETKRIEVVYQTDANGKLEIYAEQNGKKRAEIKLSQSREWKTSETTTEFVEEKELYLVYKGEGTLSLLTLNLKGN